MEKKVSIGYKFPFGEGNGNPLQCSCLENPRDGGAWSAAVYGVAQSQTRLKWLSSSCKTIMGVSQVALVVTLSARQQKRHRCIEWTFGLCGRGRRWDNLGEWHWNMYNIICEMNRQSRFDAWYRMLGAGALGWPRGMVWGGRWQGGSGWGTRVYPWRILVDVWQNQHNIVK